MQKSYITNIDLEKAISSYNEALDLKGDIISIDVKHSLGYVSASPVFAKLSSPHYNASAMDGIAVRFEETKGANEVNPVTLELGKNFAYVNTGNPITSDYDAVIMIEDVIKKTEEVIEIIVPASPWQHIRQIGEDIIVGDLIIKSNHRIRSIDLGAMISGAVTTIDVYRKPKVGIMPTGNEIVRETKDLSKGEIIDSNSSMLEGLVIECGGEALVYPPTHDDYDTLKNAVAKAVCDNDIVMINAGSSAGTKDYTVHVISELGKVIVHGVAIKPGKPTILGIIDHKPVIGIPGYPVSTYFSYDHFVKPIIEELVGCKSIKPVSIVGKLSRRIVSSFKHEEKVRVNIGLINGEYIVTPLDRGAGVTMSLVKADGVITVAKNVEGIESGEQVAVSLLKPLEEIEDTLLSIGSHDLMIDVLSDKMNVTSGHVGSLGGVMAMKRHECHIAPIHLLDSEDGSYNINIVKRYFNGTSMSIIKGVKRIQGLMVAKGNPKNITSLKDVLDNNNRYINRQNGAGTRILLDYLLAKENLDKQDISGYDREGTTHMAVAIAIKQDSADVGMGVMAAAKALDLDFIPLDVEDYDFLIETSMLNDQKVVRFREELMNDQFKNQLTSIGGYTFEHTGEVLTIE